MARSACVCAEAGSLAVWKSAGAPSKAHASRARASARAGSSRLKVTIGACGSLSRNPVPLRGRSGWRPQQRLGQSVQQPLQRGSHPSHYCHRSTPRCQRSDRWDLAPRQRGPFRQGGSTAGPPPLYPLAQEGPQGSQGVDRYGQPAHGAVMRAVASQAIRRESIPEGEEGKLRKQFDSVAVLHQRISPGGGQDES